jgi:hypothetical protein
MYKNKTASLDDLLHVGADKPVGYKLLNDLKNLSRVDPAVLEQKLKDKGLKTLLVENESCAMRGGALYAWDEAALGALLNKNKPMLNACGWPHEPKAFIEKIATDWAREKTQLFDLIADCFGNDDHPGRTDKKAADYKGRFKDSYISYLISLENRPAGPRPPGPR